MTRASAMLHGVWILAFVAALPFLLREIPMAALAAVLVVTGWRLVHVGHVATLFRNYGVLPALIWAATLVMVVATDLLTGVLVGIGLSVLEVVPYVRRLKLRVDSGDHGEGHAIRLDGVASFITLPKLSEALENSPTGSAVQVDVSRLEAIDHTSAEMVRDWFRRRKMAGAIVSIIGAEGRLPALAGV